MKQIQTITWINGNKPEEPGEYYVSCTHNKGAYIDLWDGNEWNLWTTNKYIVAYADVKDIYYDPIATSFNFMTALARLRDGKTIKSLASGLTGHIVGGETDRTKRDKVCIGDEFMFTLAEIEGLWSEV